MFNYILPCVLITRALARFPDLTRYQVGLLHALSVHPCNLSYLALYEVVQHYSAVQYATFNNTLKKSVAAGLVIRTVKHKYVFYSITQDGIKLLYAVDMELARLVKEQNEEYHRLRELGNKRL